MVAERIGGGCYDAALQEIIPLNFSLVDKLFTCARELTQKQIGFVSSKKWPQTIPVNSAVSAQQLHADANAAAPVFKKICNQIAQECGGQANFGPNNAYAVKTLGSLTRKIDDLHQQKHISIEQATQQIGDALRGTIIVDSEEQLRNVIAAVQNWIQNVKGEAIYENYFEKEHTAGIGYMGIHAIIALPFQNSQGEMRKILCELQMHLKTINDGTPNSPKERTHVFYEKIREHNLFSDNSLFQRISKLSFLSGLPIIQRLSLEEIKNLCNESFE